MDTMHSNRPERMTVIVAHEVSRYNTDIAALGGTRFAGTGAPVLATLSSGVARQPMNPGRPVLPSPSAQFSSQSLKPFQKGSTTG